MKKFLYIVLTLIILAPVVWCGSFSWLTFGGGFAHIAEWKIQRAFHLYPDAQWLGDTLGYCCWSSGQRIQYYWTPANLPNVKAHYKPYTLPFLGNRTIYHPEGKKLRIDRFTWLLVREDRTRLLNRRKCYFGQIETCIELELYPLTNRKLNLLYPPQNEHFPTSGTLIVYRYHVEDDMNPYLNDED